MHGDLTDLRLDSYRPTSVEVDCTRCHRSATCDVGALKRKYGNPTLGEVARQVARDGAPPCNLASVEGNILCDAHPVEPAVERWATLGDAKWGGWIAWLHCERRRAGLKVAKPCPGPIRLDPRTLMAALPWDFALDRLPARLECPDCGSKMLSITWVVPDPAPDPEPVARPDFGGPRPAVLDRPSKLGRRALRVAKGQRG